MKNILKALLLVLILSISITGCEKKEVEKDAFKQSKNSLNIVFPEGAPSMSMAKLIHDTHSIKDEVLNYECIKTTDLLASKLISKEADIALVPTNLGAKVYNKGLGYKLVASSIWGNLYIVSSEKISSIADLKGKEISMIGKGLTPDIVFRYILTKNNINPDTDIKINYVGGATELAPAFISGKSKISIMPEPMLSKVLGKKKDAKIVLDLQKEWSKTSKLSSSYPQVSLFVKEDFIKGNEALVEEFIKQYDASVKWANENPEQLNKYCKDLNFISEEDSISNIERYNMKNVSAKGSKKAVEEYLNVILNFEKTGIGGKLPDENFYYQAK